MESYLKNRREQLGLTQKDIAAAVNVSEATVSRWESGAIANMRRNKIKLYADILRTTPEAIMNNAAPESIHDDVTTVPPGFQPLPRMVKRPLVGAIACGEPITAEENIEDYVDVPATVRCDFCLMCRGDSMVEANIHDGDIVYIRSGVDVHNGDIAAVRIGDEATLKRIYIDREHGSVTLVPANSQYAPRTYTGEALAEIHIEGKAVGFTHVF